MEVTVSALYYYPIKSCRGHGLRRASVGPRGIVNDRLYMITDPHGEFITQREQPRLALLEPQIEGDCLILNAPGMAAVAVERRDGGVSSGVHIWGDHPQAVDQGELAADWLSSYLETPARLVHIARDYVRQVDQKYAPSASDQVGFADGYPFLLISEASLVDLNSRLDFPLEMNRFRPNIVVGGCDAFAEDTWKTIRIGEIEFELVKSCARCVTTTVDQATALKGKEPLRTLATYRTVPGRGAMFGQNMVHRNEGQLSVGDTVEIVARRES